MRLDNAYLDFRFILFEKFCYPSVLSQSINNFKWLVLFDRDTPQPYKERIKKYSEFKNLIPVFLQDFDEESLCGAISEHITDNPEFIITTRLDNDDAICRNYIRQVQDVFSPRHNELINFFWGYYLKYPEETLFLRGRVVNTFCSLIETSDSFKSVFFSSRLPHYKMADDYKKQGLLKNIMLEDMKPSWLVVFHGENIANSMDIYNAIRIPRGNILQHFDVAIVSTKESRAEVWFDRQLFHVRNFLIIILFSDSLNHLRIILGRWRRRLNFRRL